MRWAGTAFAVVAAACAWGRDGSLPALARSWSPPRLANTALVRRSAFGRPGQTSWFGPVGGFTGLGSVGRFPANCDVAVGPDAVVQVVNGQIAFYTRDGSQTFVAEAADFFAGLTTTAAPDEPRAAFDPVAQRFFVAFLEHDTGSLASHLLLGVSDDDDPAGTWVEYRFDLWRTDGFGHGYWASRPGLGFDDSGLALSCTYVRADTGLATDGVFFVLAKAPLLAGDAATVQSFIDFGVKFAQLTACPGPGPFIFGAMQTSTTMARLYGVKNAGQVGTSVLFHDAPTITTPTPPTSAPSTDGGMIETGGGTPVGVGRANDRLFMAVNAGTAGGGCAVRWSAFATESFGSGSAPRVLSGLVSLPNEFAFMPAMAVNRMTDATVLFSGCSTAVTSDVMSAGRVIGDTTTFMSVPAIVGSAGGTPYVDTRWGGYFGACVDPLDGEAFWGTAMVVRPDGQWETRIASWTVSKTWPVPPSAWSVFRGQVVSGNLASLLSEDDDWLVVRKGLVLNASEPPIQIVLDGTAPSGQVLGVSLEVVAHANTSGLSQRIQFFNWTTGLYDTVGTTGASLSDSLQSATAPGDGSVYVQTGTGAVRAKVQWFQSGIVLNNGWAAAIDLARWKIRAR